MANTDQPSGFRPAYHMGGGVIRTTEYTIADSYNTSIFLGDLVKSTGTGRNIALATAGDVNLGVKPVE